MVATLFSTTIHHRTAEKQRKAKNALKEVKAYQFSIPIRPPDLNPIENVFHLAWEKMVKDGKTLRIESETYTVALFICFSTLCDIVS